MISTSLLLLGLAGSAQAAGYWEVEYDWAPSSDVETTNPGGVFNDPLVGKIKIQYDAASSGAPLTAARLVSGNTNVLLSQAAGVLTVTGNTDVAMSPPPGGTPGTLAGAVLNLAVVTNSTTSGFLHCYDGTGPGGLCSLFFSSISASNTIPQGGSGPFTFPQFNFVATAGVGDFTAPVVTQYPQLSVTTRTSYVGKELSRVWVNAVGAPTMGVAGSGLLVGTLLLSGVRRARRR
jgi:hypothetical protein